MFFDSWRIWEHPVSQRKVKQIPHRKAPADLYAYDLEVYYFLLS